MHRTFGFLMMLLSGVFAQARECANPAGETERLACLDAAVSCAAIVSSTERLSCFDSVFGSEQQTVAEASADEVGAGDSNPSEAVAPVAQIRPRPPARTAEAPEEDFIEATISEVTSNRRDITYLFLDNGQVWRETEKTRVRFEAGQSVRIESGIFGSRNLTVNGGKRIVKVRRVQ